MLDMRGGSCIQVDLMNRMPMNHLTFDHIYASHFLEHLPYEDICKLLQECFRVLIPGGRVSVCVSNVGKFIFTYADNTYQVATLKDGSRLNHVWIYD